LTKEAGSDDDAADDVGGGGVLCDVLSSVINGLSISITSVWLSCSGFDAAGGAADEGKEDVVAVAAWEDEEEAMEAL
jgi:hypothetical protein